MLNKLNTVSWFLARPQYSGQLWHIAASRMNARKERTRTQATQWAHGLHVSEREAVLRLFPQHQWLEPERVNPVEFSNARRAAQVCPVSMGGSAQTDVLFNLVSAMKVRYALETGVAYGWSSMAMLLAGKGSRLRLASVDMAYPKLDNEDYVGCVVPETLRPRWKLIRETDRRGVAKGLSWLVKPPTLIHYDSDKSYRGRKWALPRLWDALAPGGVLVAEDVGRNVAVLEFCISQDIDPIITSSDNGYSAILQKSS